MDSISQLAKYSFITNKLRYCGPNDCYLKFLEYIKNPTDELAKEIKSYIKRFEGLLPYLELIAKKHNLGLFHPKVIEAYWIGNELLDEFTNEDLKEIIDALAKRGLPKSYADKLINNIPKGMLPHHSFNVIYVGVGKVTGSVAFNIENINNCLIRKAEIKEVKKNKVIVKHSPYVFENNLLILGIEIETEFDYLREFVNLNKGDVVSIHWNFVVDKLENEQYNNLVKYTEINVNRLNKNEL